MIIQTYNTIKSSAKINCMSNTQPMQNTKSICIKGYKIQQRHKCVVLKVLKKMLQSKNRKESTE